MARTRYRQMVSSTVIGISQILNSTVLKMMHAQVPPDFCIVNAIGLDQQFDIIFIGFRFQNIQEYPAGVTNTQVRKDLYPVFALPEGGLVLSA